MSTFGKNNPFKETDYYNGFDETKNYYEIRALAGRVAQSREDNEIQSILKHIIHKNFKTLYKDGSLVSGGSLNQDPLNPGSVKLSEAQVFFEGVVHTIPSKSLTIGNGDQRVGVVFTKQIVTDSADPLLKDPATGWENFSQPGATRLKITGEWQILGATPESPDTIEYYKFFNKQLLSASKTSEIQLFSETLARRTMDESGNYVVTGFQISPPAALPDAASPTTSIEVGGTGTSSSSKAYVNGYEVIRDYTSTVTIKKAADSSHRVLYKDSGIIISSAARNKFTYPAAFTPIASLVDGQVDIVRTIEVVRGSVTGADPLIDVVTTERSDSLIKTVRAFKVNPDGTETLFDSPSVSGRTVNWVGKTNRPELETTYKLEAVMTRKLLPSEFQVNGNNIVITSEANSWKDSIYVSGEDSRYSFDYEYYVPRTDLIVLETFSAGSTVNLEIKAIEGVPGLTPLVPATLSGAQLAIGHVTVDPGTSGRVTVTNYDVRRLTMLDLRRLLSRLERAEYNIAAATLEQEGIAKAGSQSFGLRGVFTEAFTYTQEDFQQDRVKFVRYQGADSTTPGSLLVKDKVFGFPDLVESSAQLQLATTVSTGYSNNFLFRAAPTEEIVVAQTQVTGITSINDFAVETAARPRVDSVTPQESSKLFFTAEALGKNNPYNIVGEVAKLRYSAADTTLNSSPLNSFGPSNLLVTSGAVTVKASMFQVVKNPANGATGDSFTKFTAQLGSKNVQGYIKNDGTLTATIESQDLEADKSHLITVSSDLNEYATSVFYTRGIKLGEEFARNVLAIVDASNPARPEVLKDAEFTAPISPGVDVYRVDANRKVKIVVKAAATAGIANFAYLVLSSQNVSVKVNANTAAEADNNYRYIAKLQSGKATFEVTLNEVGITEATFIAFIGGPGGFSPNVIRGLITKDTATGVVAKEVKSFGSFSSSLVTTAPSGTASSVEAAVSINSTLSPALNKYIVLSSYVEKTAAGGTTTDERYYGADTATTAANVKVFGCGQVTDTVVIGVDTANNNLLTSSSSSNLLAAFSLRSQPVGVDPTAQTFVAPASGMWASAVKVYFAEKPTAADAPSVTLEIKELVAGYPSGTVTDMSSRPASKTLTAAQVSTNAGGTTATEFRFENPVWLEPSKQYALTITSASGDYKVSIAKFKEKLLTTTGSTGTTYNNVLSNGLLLKSSDAVTWTAIQDTDLKFEIVNLKFNSVSASSAINFNAVTLGVQTLAPTSGLGEEVVSGFRLITPASAKMLTSLQWQYSTDGTTYNDFSPNTEVYFGNILPTLTSVNLNVRAIPSAPLTSLTSGENERISFCLRNSVTVQAIRRRSVARYTTKVIKAVSESGLENITKARIIFRAANLTSGLSDSGLTVNLYVRKVSVDGSTFGDWKVISFGSLQGFNVGIPGFLEYAVEKDNIFTTAEAAKHVQFKLEFTASSKSRLYGNVFKLRDLIVILNGV